MSVRDGTQDGKTWDEANTEGRLLLGFLAGLAAVSAGLLAWQIAVPEPVRWGGITIDRLSAALAVLVASVGAVTLRFSLRYLDGDSRQRHFLRLLTFSVLAAYMLMLSTNLLLLFAAWFLTSLGLHRLLTFYQERPEAQRPARKKFLISRLGDVALLAAIALIYRGWGTLDLHEFLAAVRASDGGSGVQAIALLVVIAALTKSAQFPFHSWLPETMESPTPVSALMHAGIINAGGALLLRFAPLLVGVPEALLLLVLVGTLTVTLGMLAMWAQVKVKRTLAWSTVSQMGFMMVQCGLGAFSAAAVHIVGHGFYKAWSFLRSGDLPTFAANPVEPRRAITLALVGTLLAIPALILAAWVTGFSPAHSPGELALSAVVALSIGQLWVAVLGPRGSFPLRVIGAVAGAFLFALAAFTLYQGAALFLAPVPGDLPLPTGPIAWINAVIPVVALTVLLVIHALLPVLGRTPTGRAFYVHCLHGFYAGAIADRCVDAVWTRNKSPLTGANHA